MTQVNVTVTQLSVRSDRYYKGLHYIEGAPFRISFLTIATDIDPVEGVRRLRFADDLVAAWNTRHAAEAEARKREDVLVEALERIAEPAKFYATDQFKWAQYIARTALSRYRAEGEAK